MARKIEARKPEERRAYPTARVLRSVRDDKWTIPNAIAELVDNSFGEIRGRADQVWITWDARTRLLTVLDNGQGMTDVADLFTLGKGAASGAGDIGLYGMGGSEAGIWLSETEDVYTLRRERVAAMSADWAACIAKEEFPLISNAWKSASVASCPTELLELEHGTLIRLLVRRGLVIYPEWIQERLSRLFSVGLRSGRRITWITVNKSGNVDTQIQAWNPGKLEQVIHTTVTLANGLSAVVHAGYVEGLSIDNSKLSVNYVYRQVKETTAGFGRPLQGGVGYIDLSAGWLDHITKNKDDIREDSRHLESELMEQVQVVLAPLTESLRAAKRAKIFRNIKFSLKRRFQRGFSALIDAGGGRGDGESTTPRSPGSSPTHPRRQQAAAELEIEPATNDALKGLLCKVDLEGAAAVGWINTDHPLIQLAIESEPVNQRLLEQVLIVALAKSILGSPDGLTRFGICHTKQQAEELLEKCDHDLLNVLVELQRILTDSVVAA